jgi:hypothetical protein
MVLRIYRRETGQLEALKNVDFWCWVITVEFLEVS